MSVTRIGLLGCGTVGGALVRQLLDQRLEIERRTGLKLELAAVAVRDTSTPRDGVPAELLTTDPASVVNACARLVKPGGHVFFSTLNRNPKSFLFAIVGAEYLLRLLPKGTHDYSKFIRPSELDGWIRQAGLNSLDMTGLLYNPLTQTYKLGPEVDVNYMVCTQKSAC